MKLKQRYILYSFCLFTQVFLSACNQRPEKSQVVDDNSNVELNYQIQEVGSLSECEFKTIENTIGIVTLDLSEGVSLPDSVVFLNDDGSIWMWFDYKYVEQQGGAISCSIEDLRKFYPTWKSEFSPWFFSNEPYHALLLKCTEEDADTYNVIVDETVGTTKKLKKNDSFKLSSWYEHLLQCIIGLYPNSELRNSPNVDALIVSSNNDDPYQAMEVKGDWVRIQNPWVENEQGWVQWRNGDKLLVEFYYSM